MEPTVDNIPLPTINSAARRIVDQCPGESKRDLGGMLAVGNGRGFHVLLNGKIGMPSIGGMASEINTGLAVPPAPDGRINM